MTNYFRALVLLLLIGLTVQYGQGVDVFLGKPLPSVYACNFCNFLLKWGDGQLGGLGSIAVDSLGNVYVVTNTRVEKFTSAGVFVTEWGTVGSGPGQFLGPSGIAVDSSGNVYVTDIYNFRIEKFTSTGVFITEWGSQGSGPGQFTTPRSVAVDSSGNVYVTDEGSNNRVQKFTSDGVFITSWGSFGYGNGQFDGPRGIAVDSSGNVYVTDYYYPSSGVGGRVEKFTTSGTYLSQWGSAGTGQGQFTTPQDVAVDSSGDVYVADFGNNRVEKFDGSGNFLLALGCADAATQACPLGSANGQFNNPWGVAVGPTGTLFVTDQHNGRVEKFGDRATPPTLTGPVLDSGPKSISAGQLGTWIFHYNVTANTPVTNVKVTGITALLDIVNVCVDGTCSGPVPGNMTISLAGTSVNVMILTLKFKNQFIWAIGSMNAGTSHIIAITLQGSFTVTGTINVSGPWHASATGTGNTPSTKNLTVNVTWPP